MKRFNPTRRARRHQAARMTFGEGPVNWPNAVQPLEDRLLLTADLVPPTLLVSAYVYDANPNQITCQFSEDVSASLSPGSLQVTPLAGGSAFNPVSVAFDAGSYTATFKFSGMLPEGNYQARLLASGVSDAAGNAMENDQTLDFFNLPGDANRDRVVNVFDFATMSNHYDTVGGATWAMGDFNGDHNVDFSDLVTVAQNFDHAVPAAAAAPASAAAAVTAKVNIAPAKPVAAAKAVITKPVAAAKIAPISKPVLKAPKKLFSSAPIKSGLLA